jgi:transketolase
VEEAAAHQGIVYVRTTRSATPILYEEKEAFPIGGSKVLKWCDEDRITVAAAGITLHEALRAYEELKKEQIFIRVMDLYSIKPIDGTALIDCARQTKAVITVEDHYAEGGLGEAVRSALWSEKTPVHSLAVRKLPVSGPTETLLDDQGISTSAIVEKVRTLS